MQSRNPSLCQSNEDAPCSRTGLAINGPRSGLLCLVSAGKKSRFERSNAAYRPTPVNLRPATDATLRLLSERTISDASSNMGENVALESTEGLTHLTRWSSATALGARLYCS